MTSDEDEFDFSDIEENIWVQSTVIKNDAYRIHPSNPGLQNIRYSRRNLSSQLWLEDEAPWVVPVPRWHIRASRNNFRGALTRPNTTLVSIRVQNHQIEDDNISMISDTSCVASTIWDSEVEQPVANENLISIVADGLRKFWGSTSSTINLVLDIFASVESQDAKFYEFLDALPTLDVLGSFLSKLQRDEYPLFKILLDVFESALLRFDGPVYLTYEQIFIPMAIIFYRSAPVSEIYTAVVDFATDKDLITLYTTQAQYIKHYEEKKEFLLSCSFHFNDRDENI